jgi:RNA polymerase sigma factor (sigma-70 family)
VARVGTTNWSLVYQAGADDSPAAREALSALCEAYWYPVYAMVRRYGHGSADAEDLTQAYFTRFLEKDWVKELRPEHGRFRSFLLVSVRNFLNNEKDREKAIKRGGGRKPVELDGVSAEKRYTLEPVESTTPETLFERAWAESVLARALKRLEAGETGAGRGERFEQLKGHLTGDTPEATYGELAEAWGVGGSAVRAAVSRLRGRLEALAQEIATRERFGRLLREEVADTLAHPSEVGEELRHLLTVIGPPDRADGEGRSVAEGRDE